jgi:uncharacterized protein
MLLIKPYLGCNLGCLYCYERDYRKNKKPKLNYNLKAILKKMEEFKDPPTEMALHGGEPLAMPKKDVEKLLAKMKEISGKSSIQTNGTLIDEDYIRIFKKYDTHVGISYDGPGELSRFRPGSVNLDKTIRKLVGKKIGASLIMVISKANAGTPELLGKLKNYLLELKKLNVCGRLNPCGAAPDCELGEKDMIAAYLDLAKFCLSNGLNWSPFNDISNALQGKPRVCVFMGCDSFSTSSATVLLGDGSITNCMRTNEKRILLRHPVQHNTRNQVLSEISQEFGGCRDCKYLTACHGGCPSMAIDGDWRNRTYLCNVWKELFKFYENALIHLNVPLCLGECALRDGASGPQWRHGDSPHGDSHSDSHGDSGRGNAPHGDSDSKNIPHGDWENHADHIDLDHQDNRS